MSRVPDWLQEPEVAGCPVDGLARFEAHRSVLRRKRMIRSVFDGFHKTFQDLDRRYFCGEGQVIELNARPTRATTGVSGELAEIPAEQKLAAPVILQDRELAHFGSGVRCATRREHSFPVVAEHRWCAGLDFE